MAKTLDQLPIAVAPTADDRFHIQQNGLDKQIRFGALGDAASLQEVLWNNFRPRVIGSVINITTTSPAIPFWNSAGNVLDTISNFTFNAVNGTLTAPKVINSVWNDIVDFVEVNTDASVEFGKVYIRKPDYSVGKSEEYMQKGALGVASDTYGFGVGQKPAGTPQIPIAIGGFVLAYVDKLYTPGTPLTCGPDGILMEFDEGGKARFPERILAIFDRPEPNKQWNGIQVNGRCWVKVV